jgi:hypothetical protein
MRAVRGHCGLFQQIPDGTVENNKNPLNSMFHSKLSHIFMIRLHKRIHAYSCSVSLAVVTIK